MFVLLEIAFSFVSHGHIWQVTWPEYKSRINSHSLHLSLMQQKPTGRVHLDAKSAAWICWNSCYWRNYDVSKTLWRHIFYSNANFNESMLQTLLFDTLYPLALVSTEKDVSCSSLYGFCILVAWLTKYGHDYQNWRQPLQEQTWPKTKPRMLRHPRYDNWKSSVATI